jgi:tetratricopeptide (TPR) repeat protein
MKKLFDVYLNFINKQFLRNFIEEHFINAQQVEEHKIVSRIKRLLFRVCLSSIFIIIVGIICIRMFDIYKHNSGFVNTVDDYYQGNYHDAKKSIEKSFIDNNNQNSLVAYYIRGSINFKLNRYYDALKDLSLVSSSESLKNIHEDYFLNVQKQFFFSDDKYYHEYKQPVIINTFLMKSNCKMKLKDYRGAIIDASVAIDTLVKYQNNFDSTFINEKYISLRYVIGCANFKLNKLDNSLYSFNEIIKWKGEYLYPRVYIYKGLITQMKKEKDSACLYYSKAGELGDASAYAYINKWCK